jgi:tRNA-(ms[2]io[6]A)-hydroxylase
VSAAAAPFAHPLLRVPTPDEWVREACAQRDVLLIDHANCEKKAASTALALMFAYAEDLELTDKMSRLAREELRHYEQVAKLFPALGVAPRRLAPGRYAAGMRRLAAAAEPQREVDLMICGAFIEARSCERFGKLAGAIGPPLSDLFGGLHNAEARHYRVYMDMARRAAKRARDGVSASGGGAAAPLLFALEARIAEFAVLEAELITLPDAVFRFHSGPPEQGGTLVGGGGDGGPGRADGGSGVCA